MIILCAIACACALKHQCEHSCLQLSFSRGGALFYGGNVREKGIHQTVINKTIHILTNPSNTIINDTKKVNRFLITFVIPDTNTAKSSKTDFRKSNNMDV
mmetsp:Transcript_12363/g.16531  ORF Transcript_12363/g.16531 Transcript_12363/m.16531 type:complete len:100 (-) Transcript_12363:1255-1554(-)